MSQTVSVIVTVRNEEGTVDVLLRSLSTQSRKADEIIIVDGGSVDRTVDVVQSYLRPGLPIKLIVAEGSNISQGRNIAISAAQGEIIASTDAGVRLPPNWLQTLVAAFDPRDGLDAPDVVAGFFLPDPQTVFETAMGATVLPTLAEIELQSFLPSSRSVAFSKNAWKDVGGYPEWLDYSEDVVFDLSLRGSKHRFAFAPDAVAYFRPRKDLKAFFRQYFLYARGDGKANLWPKRHLLRYLAYTLGPIALVAGFWYKLIWLLVVVAAGFYLQRPYRRLWPALKAYGLWDQASAVLWVPVIRVVGDVAKMMGYPVGMRWRLTSRR